MNCAGSHGLPKVSVIVCCYNAGEYLLPSVRSILDQTYQNIELLLVDDGSTDGSPDRIRNLQDSRIRIIRQENAGKAVALNRALQEIRGDFYAIQDADDLSYPCRIEHLVKTFLDNADLAAVFSGYDLMIDGRRLAPGFRAKDRMTCARDIEAFRMPSHDPTVMFRREKVEGIEYEPTLIIGQGYDYILRVGERHPMVVLGECLYTYRVHDQSRTRRAPIVRERMVLEIIKCACERRGLDFENVKGPARYSKRGMADNNLAATFMESAVDLRAAGRQLEAIKTGIECIRLRPLSLHHHKALVYAILPTAIRKMLRPSERLQST